MASGYKNPQFQPVEDFLFKPNLKLAEKVGEREDRYFEGLSDKISLLGNVNMDYIKDSGADTQSAKVKSDTYNAKAEDAAKAMMEDPFNTGRNNSIIKGLSTQLKDDYLTGDISKIQKNAVDYKDFKNQVSKLSPEEQKYYNLWSQKELTQDGVNGDYSKNHTFTPPMVVPEKHVTSDFLSSENYKALKKSIILETGKDGKAIDNHIRNIINGGYIQEVGADISGISPQRIQKTFSQYVADNYSTLLPYAYTAEDVYGEKWFKSPEDRQEGKLSLDDPSTVLGGAFANIPSTYATMSVKQGKGIKGADPYSFLNRKSANQVAVHKANKMFDANFDKKHNKPITGALRDVSFITRNTREGQERLANLVNQKAAAIRLGVGIAENTTLDTYVKNKDMGSYHKYLASLEDKIIEEYNKKRNNGEVLSNKIIQSVAALVAVKNQFSGLNIATLTNHNDNMSTGGITSAKQTMNSDAMMSSIINSPSYMSYYDKNGKMQSLLPRDDGGYLQKATPSSKAGGIIDVPQNFFQESDGSENRKIMIIGYNKFDEGVLSSTLHDNSINANVIMKYIDISKLDKKEGSDYDKYTKREITLQEFEYNNKDNIKTKTVNIESTAKLKMDVAQSQ